MDHIDEHTLELFVLGSDSVRTDGERIRAHLAVCEGCRRLVDGMRESYARVEVAFRDLEAGPEALQPVRRRGAVQPDVQGMPVRDRRPVTRWEHARYFVRRHPLMSGAGAFGALALAAALVLQAPDQAARTSGNPLRTRANSATGTLEVFGAGDVKLWELPAMDLQAYLDAEKLGLTHTSVADLDGDGGNEVITVLPTTGAGAFGRRPLLVYAADRTLRFSRLAGESVVYDGREYPGPFGAGILATGDFGGGAPEMVVRVDNGRSPGGVLRYSSAGELLGEYWHYGVIHVLYAMDVNGDGRPEVVIGGQNDVEEERGDTARFAFLAVLDASRIRGRTASVSSPAFELPPSEAELLYMRFPQTDMNLALARGAFIHRVQVLGGAAESIRYGVWFRGAVDGPGELLIEYHLAEDFSCLGVYSTDKTDRLHAGLRSTGRVVGTLDGSYFEGLRRGIRYLRKTGWGAQAGWLAPPA